MPLACELVIDSGLTFARVPALQALIASAPDVLPDAFAGSWSMTLRLVDDREISRLHNLYFGDSSPTDVIAFPSGDVRTGSGAYLGDVAVSVDTAGIQASDVGHSMEREVAFLALHGLLHLLGHVDASEDDRDAMLALQTMVLTDFEERVGRPW